MKVPDPQSHFPRRSGKRKGKIGAVRHPLKLAPVIVLLAALLVLGSLDRTSEAGAPRTTAPESQNWREHLQPAGPPVTVRVTPGQGGTLRSPDGQVTVTFPPGAVSEAVDAAFTPLQRWTWGAPGQRVVTMFELKASTAASGALSSSSPGTWRWCSSSRQTTTKQS